MTKASSVLRQSIPPLAFEHKRCPEDETRQTGRADGSCNAHQSKHRYRNWIKNLQIRDVAEKTVDHAVTDFEDINRMAKGMV
jgi:hypothetical protein